MSKVVWKGKNGTTFIEDLTEEEEDEFYSHQAPVSISRGHRPDSEPRRQEQPEQSPEE